MPTDKALQHVNTMAEGTGFILYTLEFCPRCEIVKEFLKAHHIEYEIADMASAGSLTELRVNGIFVQEAPVLQHGKIFLTSKELFAADTLNEEVIFRLC